MASEQSTPTIAEASTEVPIEVTVIETADSENASNKPSAETAETAERVDPHLALMQMSVTDQNSALNCLIGFVGLAQRRGVFALDEAAKAFECVKMFHPVNKDSQ